MSTFLRIADLAADQGGLFTAAQAADVGITAKLLHRYTTGQRIERIVHGVYRIAGAPPTPQDELRANWLATNAGALATRRLDDLDVVVSHRSAARLHGLGDLDADVHEFTSTTRRQTRRDAVRFYKGSLAPTDVTVIDGLPVTTIERTIGDLAGARLDGEHLAGVVRDAMLTAHVATDRIAFALDPHAHHYGQAGGESLAVHLIELAGAPHTTRGVPSNSRPTR